MGQRLIISEEEKKGIMVLYETTTDNSSILIANKNPFRDNEYVNARKRYSTNMKYGDLFYNFKDLEKYRAFSEKFNNEKIDEFVKSIIGKTFKGDDNISYKIEDLKLKDTSYGTPHYDYILTNLSNSEKLSGIMTILGYLSGKDIKSTIRFHYNERKPDGTTFNEPVGLNQFYSDYVLENCLQNMTYLKFPMIPDSEKLKIEKVPDEYFEIRKLQTPKSDVPGVTDF